MKQDDIKGASRFQLRDLLVAARQECETWRLRAELALETVERQGARLARLLEVKPTAEKKVSGQDQETALLQAQLRQLREELVLAHDAASTARLNVWLNRYGEYLQSHHEELHRCISETKQRNGELELQVQQLKTALAAEHGAAAAFVTRYAEAHFNKKVSIERYLIADTLTDLAQALQKRPPHPLLGPDKR